MARAPFDTRPVRSAGLDDVDGDALRRADLAFIDVGPSLGALNRAALLACDAVVLPLAPDLFSLQGMRNVGPVLRTWREDWRNNFSNSSRHRSCF